MQPAHVSTNRRNFLRLARSCPVQFRVLERNLAIPDTETPTNAVMKNLSAGGVCFTSPVYIETRRMLALELDLPGVAGPLLCMGKTIWCQRVETAIPRYEVGVEFWWVGLRDETAQREIHRFLQNALQEYPLE
jgi:hypothetical protein